MPSPLLPDWPHVHDDFHDPEHVVSTFFVFHALSIADPDADRLGRNDGRILGEVPTIWNDREVHLVRPTHSLYLYTDRHGRLLP